MVNLQAIGHLGKDAQVNDVNGKKVINFSVAHSHKYKDGQGNEVNSTLWIECSYWNDKTRVAEYLKQGTQVHVAGTPSLDSYKNKDNVTVPKLRLRVSEIQLLGSKAETPTSSIPPLSNSPSDISPVSDDLPF